MQEEVENKSVAISIKATKLTANVLKAALLKALAEMEKKQKNPKVYKGKQSVKHLSGRVLGSATSKSRTATSSLLRKLPGNTALTLRSKRMFPPNRPGIWSFSRARMPMH